MANNGDIIISPNQRMFVCSPLSGDCVVLRESQRQRQRQRQRERELKWENCTVFDSQIHSVASG